MVAPHNNGRLTRSLVRIPGSGSCSAAGSVYKDFSRVSGVAAMVAAQHPPPQAMVQAQHRRLSSGMDAAFFRKMAAIEDSLAEGAGVEIGGSEARWARREAPDLRAGTLAVGGASARPAAGGGVPASMRTSALPARDRRPDGGQRKRLRSPSEGNGEAVVPPQAKAPKVMSMAVPVVGGAGAVSPAPGRGAAAALVPTPSEGPAGVKGADAWPAARMAAAGPFVLSDESLKQLLDQRNQLLQENQALSQRVQAFQQLFRNRTRLTSVLRTLGLTVV